MMFPQSRHSVSGFYFDIQSENDAHTDLSTLIKVALSLFLLLGLKETVT